jgi:hypothetical protein
LRSAHALARELSAEPLASPDALLRISRAGSAYRRKLITLAYLAPDIQDAILEGRHPPELTLERLMAMELPLAWSEQRTLLGLQR